MVLVAGKAIFCVFACLAVIQALGADRRVGPRIKVAFDTRALFCRLLAMIGVCAAGQTHRVVGAG